MTAIKFAGLHTGLTLSTMGTIFSRRQIEIYFLFLPESGFDISCKLSPVETI